MDADRILGAKYILVNYLYPQGIPTEFLFY